MIERLAQSIHAAIISDTIFGNKCKFFFLFIYLFFANLCIKCCYLVDLVKQLEVLPQNDVLQALLKRIQI